MMHKYTQNQSYVGSSGQILTTDVSMTLCSWQICHQAQSHVAAIHLYRIKLGTKLIRSRSVAPEPSLTRFGEG